MARIYSITKEILEKWLDVIFDRGYAGDINQWQSEWFLGWLSVDHEHTYDVVISVNVDCTTSENDARALIFDVYAQGEVSFAEIESYIRGIMHVIAPKMKCYDTLGNGSRTLTFMYEMEYDESDSDEL